MKNHLKKLFSLTLIAVMMLSMGTVASAEQQIELVWATFKGGWIDTLEEIFDVYEAEHPNVHITVYTGESGDFFGDLKALLGTGALPNIFNMRGDSFGMEWAEYLQDVGDSAAIANVKDGFTEGFTWDGVTYGAYYNYEIHGSTWNMNTLGELGYESYPTSNTQFLETIQKEKDAGKKGMALYGNAQKLYNHLGNAPLVMHDDVKAFYDDVVSGNVNPIDDPGFNNYFDWIESTLPYIDEHPIANDDSNAYPLLYATNQYDWSVLDGTTGIYYGYDSDYTDNWEIGPFCITDEDVYYVLNCQGYVVSNTGDDATNAAALDLYNWFYTNDYVAERLTEDYSILTTLESYVLPEDALDTMTYKAYKAIETFDFKPITYYMSSELCNEYAAIQQQFIAGVMTKEEALSAVGEAFRNFG